MCLLFICSDSAVMLAKLIGRSIAKQSTSIREGNLFISIVKRNQFAQHLCVIILRWQSSINFKHNKNGNVREKRRPLHGLFRTRGLLVLWTNHVTLVWMSTRDKPDGDSFRAMLDRNSAQHECVNFRIWHINNLACLSVVFFHV